ncbi:MAG: SPOR domain-containing protein [Spirochaetaceae bacterium]|nr:SPOR domain-containing protein [Spirochaetaceae bacterium]
MTRSGKGFCGFFCFFLILICPVSAQTRGKTFLREEIQRLSSALKNSGVSGTQRRELLTRQARLYQLNGDFEEAAKAWSGAAQADQEKRDDTALLEEGFCLFALGELEKAETAGRTALAGAKDSAIQHRAKYLLAQVEAFRSGDVSPLIELISDPGYDRYKPGIYYTVWKFSGADRYKTRLLSEYPSSPEAMLMKNAGPVRIFPSPLWVFFPGRSFAGLDGEEDSAPERAPGAIQTGLFGKEENARAMAVRLTAAGFDAKVTERAADDGGSYWVVTVPPGPDINRTIASLKEKGFESFPVF